MIDKISRGRGAVLEAQEVTADGTTHKGARRGASEGGGLHETYPSDGRGRGRKHEEDGAEIDRACRHNRHLPVRGQGQEQARVSGEKRDRACRPEYSEQTGVDAVSQQGKRVNERSTPA